MVGGVAGRNQRCQLERNKHEEKIDSDLLLSLAGLRVPTFALTLPKSSVPPSRCSQSELGTAPWLKALPWFFHALKSEDQMPYLTSMAPCGLAPANPSALLHPLPQVSCAPATLTFSSCSKNWFNSVPPQDLCTYCFLCLENCCPPLLLTNSYLSFKWQLPLGSLHSAPTR